MDPELSDIEQVLKQIFHSFVPDPEKSIPTPESFAQATAGVFAETYLEYFKSKARYFDKISGCDGSITNAFLATEPLSQLLERVATGIAATAERIATNSDTSDAANRLPALGGESQPRADDPVAEPHESCAIINIKLSGPTIRAAWQRNELTKSLEDAARRPTRQDPSWSPDRTTLMPVYHGTRAPSDGYCRFANSLASFDTAETILLGSVFQNQAVPVLDLLPTVWTSFSPLRSVLWAMFLSEVLGDIPTETTRRELAQSYVCPSQPRHTHEGIRLLEFYPRAQGENPPRVFVMPRDVEDEWNRLAGDRQGLLPVLHDFVLNHNDTSFYWAYFARLHGESGTNAWPQVFHCHETPVQSMVLSRLTSQLWRTAWTRDGIDQLNRGKNRVFSISFDFSEASENTTTS